MFLKVIFTFLAVGALSTNALGIPVTREPAPEPDFQDVMARDEFETRELEARFPGLFKDNRFKSQQPGETSGHYNARLEAFSKECKKKGECW